MNMPRVSTVRYHERVVWAAVLIGIPAWLVHLVFEAAMVEVVCRHPSWLWTLHLATALTALVTLGGMAVCFDLLRAAGPPDPEGDDGSPVGLTRFLGGLGLLVGAANLALILLEGSYVIFVRRCG
jgi:hypothetical protein